MSLPDKAGALARWRNRVEFQDMINVTLPDGKVLEMEDGATVLTVAEKIGPRLAKAALGAKLNGEVVDLMRPLDGDARF
jgi:threonyl-tRNA synthetase